MVRFNDKSKITELNNADILPMTDISESSEDKKVTVEQLSKFTVDNIEILSDGKSLTDNNLSNELKDNYDEAYKGVYDGIAPYSATKTYSVGNIVKLLDSENKPVLYYSVLDNNIGNTPETDDGSNWRELTLSSGGGLDVLDIGWALYVDEATNTRRILNGQLIMQNQFERATNRLKALQANYPNLFCTEDEWQEEKLASQLGQVGKFVIDDIAGSIRLPNIINVTGAESLYQAGIRQDADSSKVQPENVKGVWFIQLNSEIEESEKPINDYQVNNVYAYGMSMYYQGIMNNNSWLRSNGQWNTKAIYEGLYNWILENTNEENEGFKFSTDDYNDYDWVINTTDETFRLPLKNGQEGMFINGAYPVVGTGSGLGLIANNPSFEFGLAYGYYSNLAHLTTFDNSGLNQDAGSTPSSMAYPSSTPQVVGVTTDATKSGIIADISNIEVPENYNLYYYCGDTLQNTTLMNTARLEEILAGEKLPKLKLNCYREQFILPGNTHKSIQIKGDTFLKLNFNGYTRNFYNKDTIELDVLEILDAGEELTAGKDYYIYLIQDPNTRQFSYQVSLNATYPTGATEATAYQIGGFHTLCVSVTASNAPALPAYSLWDSHPAIGYNAGDIIPNSIWCETHRPACPNPAGMVYVDLLDLWVDIYLQSGTYTNTASAYGATVTDSRTQIQHLWDMQLIGKRLAKDIEFMIFAEGSNQQTTIYGSAAPSPKTSGGHLDTASKRMISGYFIEECCGYLWQWLDELGPTGGSSFVSYGDEVTRGKSYGMPYCLRAGGPWTASSSCGSRSRSASSVRSFVSASYGGRGVSLPKFAR